MCHLAIQNSVCSHNTYILKYSEVNRTNEETIRTFLQVKAGSLSLSPTLNTERKFALRVMGEGSRAGRRVKVILPNG